MKKISSIHKEFGRWFKKKVIDYSHASYYKDKYEEGWEAALRWIQREYMKAREGRDVRFDLGLCDLLKKELGEPFVAKNTEFIIKVEEELKADAEKSCWSK